MDEEKIKAIIGGASGSVAASLFHFLSAREEAEITRELGDKYGEIAEEMKEERRKSEEVVGEKAESGVSPARAYRRELESRGNVCGICLQMLRRLEDKPPEMQAMGVPQIAEAEGASQSGASKEELKEIMSKSDVLKSVLMEMREES